MPLLLKRWTERRSGTSLEALLGISQSCSRPRSTAGSTVIPRRILQSPNQPLLRAARSGRRSSHQAGSSRDARRRAARRSGQSNRRPHVVVAVDRGAQVVDNAFSGIEGRQDRQPSGWTMETSPPADLTREFEQVVARSALWTGLHSERTLSSLDRASPRRTPASRVYQDGRLCRPTEVSPRPSMATAAAMINRFARLRRDRLPGSVTALEPLLVIEIHLVDPRRGGGGDRERAVNGLAIHGACSSAGAPPSADRRILSLPSSSAQTSLFGVATMPGSEPSWPPKL